MDMPRCSYPDPRCLQPVTVRIELLDDTGKVVERKGYCSRLHAAQDMLTDAAMSEPWVLEEVQRRVEENRRATEQPKRSAGRILRLAVAG